MNKPGADFKTRTINIPGVVNELLHNLEVRLTETIKDYSGDSEYQNYLDQDWEKFEGALELMANLNFIDRDRFNEELENGHRLYRRIVNKPLNEK